MRRLQAAPTARRARRRSSRHDACATSHASGAPATTAPRFPANIVTPTTVAKRSAGNHSAQILRIAMNATETPMPTSVRPSAAISHAGATPNSSEPGGGDQRAGSKNAARSERVREHADRDLQQRVDVEIGRGERAEDRAADIERSRELARNRRRRRSVEERQHVARERDAEDQAARGDETRVGPQGVLRRSTQRRRSWPSRHRGGQRSGLDLHVTRPGPFEDHALFVMSVVRTSGRPPMHAIGRPLLPPGPTSPMAYRDLRDFIAQLETTGELKRVHAPRRSAASR